ncbi:MAG: primosomal protein N' [Pseudomonadota bacterium]|nr:primosomal protein N' [Pseudomonadota bacterium]
MTNISLQSQEWLVTVVIQGVKLPLSYKHFAEAPLTHGAKVLVDYRNREKIGFVIHVKPYLEHQQTYTVKPTIKTISKSGPHTPSCFTLHRKIMHTYCASDAETWHLMLPSMFWQDFYPYQCTYYYVTISEDIHLYGKQLRPIARKLIGLDRASQDQLLELKITLKQQQKLQEQGILTQDPSPSLNNLVRDLVKNIVLSKSQQDVFDHVISNFNQNKTQYIHGVTGSGKTFLYLALARHIIQKGKQVMILVPEISITPQLMHQVEQYFPPEATTCLHSGLSDKQRYYAWLRCCKSEISLLIGTRSCLFTPMPNLGLIIIDEEHDSSYKQQSGIRYHARTVAFLRCRINSTPLIMGSATPSLASYHHIMLQRIIYHPLTSRYGNAPLPKIVLENTTQQRTEAGIAQNVWVQIQQHLNADQKVLVFINRRGYSPIVWCTSCDKAQLCKHCDKPYTYHQKDHICICHRCFVKQKVPERCAYCNRESTIPLGHGTEKITSLIQKKIPTSSVIRVDKDTCGTFNQLSETLETIHKHTAAVIVSTQLMIKSHHIKGLSLVVFIDADKALHSRDFKAKEHLLQEAYQLAGRAGREGDHPAEMIIQTTLPHHTIWPIIINQDYLGAAKTLLCDREQAQLPPFSHQAVFNFQHKNDTTALNFVNNLYQNLPRNVSTDCLPPFKSFTGKLSGYYRYSLLVQTTDRYHLIQQLRTILSYTTKLTRGIRWHLDLDPLEL